MIAWRHHRADRYVCHWCTGCLGASGDGVSSSAERTTVRYCGFDAITPRGGCAGRPDPAATFHQLPLLAKTVTRLDRASTWSGSLVLHGLKNWTKNIENGVREMTSYTVLTC